MPTYCAYENYTSEEWQTLEEDGDLYSCEDSHCGECENECMGCPECNPDNYDEDGCYIDPYSSRTPQLGDVWPGGINGYGYKPSPIFWSVGGFNTARLSGRFGKRLMFFGIEVETEASDRLSRDAYGPLTDIWNRYEELTQRLYSKHDGSLHNGVEIVSHPMTLDSWRELHADGQMRFYRDLYRAGLHSTERTGMHIHVNKSSFSSMGHLARFTHLVIDNPAYFKCVADRDEEGYASFTRFKISEVIRSNGHVYGPRGAINLQNPQTAEVRMFAASLRPKVVLGNIELCHALQTYTRTRFAPDKEKGIQDHLSFLSFAEWITENGDLYSHALPMVGKALSEVTERENRSLAMSLRPSRRFY